MKSKNWSEYLTRRFAAATYGLIVLNTIVFIGSQDDPVSVFERFGLVPAHLSLLSMFTSMFIHSDIFHLAVNMFLLWLFGRSVEFAMGGVEYLIFYVASGFAAAVLHVAIVAAFALDPTVSAVGASGAIAGILGVFAIRYYRMKFSLGPVEIPALLVLLGWLLVQAVLGFVSLWMTTYNVLTIQVDFRSVGYWSHIGGFVFGMVVAQLTRMDVLGQKDYLTGRARERMENGTLLEVVRCYDDLTHSDPADPIAHAELGRTWAMLNDREQSVPAYQKSVSLFLKSGQGDEAWNAFLEMRRYWPGAKVDPSTRFRLAGYLEQTGLYTEAVEAYKRIAEESRDSVEAPMALFKAQHIQLNRLNDSDGVRQSCRRLKEMYPESDWNTYIERFSGNVVESVF